MSYGAAQVRHTVMQHPVGMDVGAVEQDLGRVAPRLVPVRTYFGEIASADASRRDDHVLGIYQKLAAGAGAADARGAPVLHLDSGDFGVEQNLEICALGVSFERL